MKGYVKIGARASFALPALLMLTAVAHAQQTPSGASIPTQRQTEVDLGATVTYNSNVAASDAEFAAAFHTYGMIWSPGRVQYYVDDPGHPYATYTRADLPTGAVWPFDDGRYFFVLNLAMGGDWPGPPAATTPATVEVLVDYVRVYTN